jgi:hypothetical protein
MTSLRSKADRRPVTTVEYCLIGAVLVATVAVGFSMLANNASTSRLEFFYHFVESGFRPVG